MLLDQGLKDHNILWKHSVPISLFAGRHLGVTLQRICCFVVFFLIHLHIMGSNVQSYRCKMSMDAFIEADQHEKEM